MIQRRLLPLAAIVVAAPLCHAAHAQSAGWTIDKFSTTWAPSSNPDSYGEATDGLFKMDGTYCVPYSNQYTDEMNPANISFGSDAYGSILNLTVQPGTHYSTACGTTAYGDAEIASNPGWEPRGVGTTPPFGPSTYGYGFYEARMKPSCVQGETASFFWIQAPSYGPLELDVEFPDPPGHAFNDVHWTIHPSGQSVDFDLGFNPCSQYHRYGFLWTAGKVVFTVDGVAKQTFVDPTLTTTATGFVMANALTGIASWGAGPPTQPAVNSYRWIRFHANATSFPGPAAAKSAD